MKLQDCIENKIKMHFQPIYFEVVNESHNHNVPMASETHFKVLVVSEKFTGLNRIQRQRWVYEVLDEELKTGIHALTQRALTPEEWQNSSRDFKSPPCHGGVKKDRPTDS